MPLRSLRRLGLQLPLAGEGRFLLPGRPAAGGGEEGGDQQQDEPRQQPSQHGAHGDLQEARARGGPGQQDQHAQDKQDEDRLKTVSRDLDRGEGIFGLLGDPLVLATEEENLGEESRRLQQEYDALDLALDALREANNRLQTLFSPLISRRAAALMAQMTDGSYAGVYFDREMHFSALRSGDLDARALEYLSEGTRSQLYLAVRLAICELVLPPEEPCPLILDDVLAAFDDKRAKDTLRLLKELSKERQILLLTCQSREKRLQSTPSLGRGEAVQATSTVVSP